MCTRFLAIFDWRFCFLFVLQLFSTIMHDQWSYRGEYYLFIVWELIHPPTVSLLFVSHSFVFAARLPFVVLNNVQDLMLLNYRA